MRVRTLCLVAGVGACAPITTTKRVVEKPKFSETTKDAPIKGKMILLASATNEGIVVGANDPLTCAQHDVSIIGKTEVKTRHANRFVIALEYIAGIGFGGVGGFTAGSPEKALDIVGHPDANQQQTRIAGIAGAGLGLISLVAAIVDTASGGTTSLALPDERRTIGKARSIDCGSSPHVGAEVMLAIGDRTWPIGVTDADGKAVLAWTALDAKAFEGDGWKSAKVTSAGVDGVGVDLAAALPALGDRAWTELAAKPSLEGVRAFKKEHPGSHDAEVAALLQKLADERYATELDAALAHADLPAVKKLVAEWTADAPDGKVRDVRAAEIADLEAKGPVAFLNAKFEAAMVAQSFDVADKIVIELERVDPKLGAGARTRAMKERATADTKRIANARTHAASAKHFARHGEIERAKQEVVEAKKLAADDAQVISAVTYVAGYCDKDPKCKGTMGETGSVAVEIKREDDAAKKKADELAAAKAKKEEALAAAAAKAASELAAKKERDAAAAAEKAAREAKRAEEIAAAKAKRDEELAAAKAKQEEADAAAKAKREAAAAANEADRKKREAEALAAKAEREKKRAEEAAARAAQVAAEKAKREETTSSAAKAKLDAEIAAKAKRDEAAAAAAAKAKTDAKTIAADRPFVPPAQAGQLGAGLWTSSLGNGGVWLLDLKPDGTGNTAIMLAGRIVATRAIAWRSDAVTIGAQTIRPTISQWRKQ